MFYLLVVLLFAKDPTGFGAGMASRQALQPKFEATAAACRADALKALTMQQPTGVIVGVRCDGPMQDPTVPLLRN